MTNKNKLPVHSQPHAQLGFLAGTLIGIGWGTYSAARSGKKISKAAVKAGVHSLTEQIPDFVDSLVDQLWERGLQVVEQPLSGSKESVKSVTMKSSKRRFRFPFFHQLFK